MKKIISLALAFIMSMSVVVFAEKQDDELMNKGFRRLNAKVEEREKDNDVDMLTVSADGSKTVLLLGKTLLLNLEDGKLYKNIKEYEKEKTQIKVGDEITVFIKNNQPQTMSIPPQTNPTLIAVNNSKKYSVDVDYFNENGIGISNRLVINNIKETKVLDIEGNKVEEPAMGKTLIVLYTVSTRSLPPQTNPETVYVLESKVAEKPVQEKSVEEILKENFKPEVFEGTEFYQLRKVFEKAGANIEWDNATRTIKLSKDAKSVSVNTKDKVLTLGEKQVKLDKFFIENGISYADVNLYKLVSEYYLSK